MRKVLITGGSRGIGKACVEEFAKNGCEVVFTWLKNKESADNLQASLAGSKVSHFQLDLTCIHPESLFASISEQGPFDIVVHNAAFADDVPFFFMQENQWDSVTQASLNSFFHLNKAIIAHMIEKKWGRIITLASISGEAGNRGQTNYAAAKGALIAATKSLAKELGRKGILCNIVSPGLIDTDMTKDLALDIKQHIPVGRLGRPEEVAKAIAFLASDHASYINGTILQVNGGLYT